MNIKEHAARLREMAKVVQEEASKYKRHNCGQRFDYLTADAASLIAGAEALERTEVAVEVLRDINYFIGVKAHEMISQALAEVEGRKKKSDE
jgi:hypothetical protein